MTFAIRTAHTGDAQPIAEVHVRAWHTTYAGLLPDDYLRSLSVARRRALWEEVIADIEAGSTTQCLVVAESLEHGIVGFAAGGKTRTEHPDFDSELYAIYVAEAHQGCGLGRRLTLALVHRLCDLNYQGMLLWVLEQNPSRQFYEKLGGALLPLAEEVDFDGHTRTEVAYGWRDLTELRSRLEPQT